MSIAGVSRELLVRYLDAWAPVALHSGRRVTFAQAWAAQVDVATAEAALRVFAEFADRMRGRQLTIVVVAAQTAELSSRLGAVQAELSTPPELGVHTVAGGLELLPAALVAAGAAGAPLLVHLDTDGFGGADPRLPLGAVMTGRPAELLLLTTRQGWPGYRRAMRAAGFELTTGVELVDSAAGTDRLLAFATRSAKSLETFKNALWAVDEYAGVRYCDPSDPQRHLLDISLSPHPGPLRRELVTHLVAVGECSVTDLRRFTLTETVYRTSDTTGALLALLAAGAVTRRPGHGRLAGDVLIAAAR